MCQCYQLMLGQSEYNYTQLCYTSTQHSQDWPVRRALSWLKTAKPPEKCLLPWRGTCCPLSRSRTARTTHIDADSEDCTKREKPNENMKTKNKYLLIMIKDHIKAKNWGKGMTVAMCNPTSTGGDSLLDTTGSNLLHSGAHLRPLTFSSVTVSAFIITLHHNCRLTALWPSTSAPTVQHERVKHDPKIPPVCVAGGLAYLQVYCEPQLGNL